MNLNSFDYYSDTETTVGFANIASTIRDIRSTTSNSLFFDNGDLIQGPPLTDLWLDDENHPHPAIACLNAMDYDCATLGNHEFNFGIDPLVNVYKQTKFPVVSTNITRVDGGDWPFKTAVILDRVITTAFGRKFPIKIGVMGFTPAMILTWDQFHTAGKIDATAPISTAETAVQSLKSKGAEVIVALCHGGIETQVDTTHEHFASAIAAISGIDAVFAGHTHLPFAGKIGRTPIALPAAYGKNIGRITLNLRRSDRGWATESGSADLITPSEQADTQIKEIVADRHAKTLAFTQKQLGTFTGPLHSYFARVQPDLAQFITAQAQLDSAREALDASDYAELPRLSATSPFRCGGRGGPDAYIDIDAGPATNRHAAQLYPFPNQTVALLVSGTILREWLEQSAAHFKLVTPNATDTLLFDDTTVSYNLDTLFGVTYDFDLSRPTGERVKNLCHEGKSVQALDQFVVLTNSYRAHGGGGFTMLPDTQKIWTSGRPLQSAIAARLAEPLPRRCPKVWGYVPLGATVVFDTSPNASAHLLGDSPLNVQPVSPSMDGFYRYRMEL
ncbi:hypothetical protein BVC71_00995 [Marivivens niveibacter]|uniref:2',3'-cyclic-nucleotide 2'-phosphodiesterase n=2 Tax=Marivivens niveibacter TaxID=1930667 RepID=A0A251X0B0_9RHOB|nr:hypothetical protein BVC71_00995 [Marivivens niveibacter]